MKSIDISDSQTAELAQGVLEQMIHNLKLQTARTIHGKKHLSRSIKRLEGELAECKMFRLRAENALNSVQ